MFLGFRYKYLFIRGSSLAPAAVAVVVAIVIIVVVFDCFKSPLVVM